MRKYIKTHPWLSFELHLEEAPWQMWLLLGECRSKCAHLAGVPLRPEIARDFYSVYLAKGAHGSAAIEGNTLSEEEVRRQVDGTLDVPKSREYLRHEVDNIIKAMVCTAATGTIGPRWWSRRYAPWLSCWKRAPGR